jgi:hypothetical protein
VHPQPCSLSSHRAQEVEQVFTLFERLHAVPLEVGADPHIDMEPSRILVEVQERPGATMEDPDAAPPDRACS